MPSLNLLQTSVGRKILTGVTGILLTLFLVAHLAGNLTLFAPDGGTAFNLYADFLHNLGPILIVFEIVLIILFLLHAYIGISIYRGRKKARPENYTYYKSQGGPSKQDVASKTMIYTGLVILFFVVFHVIHFKYNFFMPHETVTHEGREMINLAYHVSEAFQNPLITLFYTIVMVLIGFHLKHGVWSSFISLGVGNPKLTALLYTIGTVVAIALAAGFLIIPIYIFLNGGI
jgi:succinate dehydrogenase / fumarate reductase cytochrome b subunit